MDAVNTFLKTEGYRVLEAFDRFNPYPSDEVKKSQSVYEGSWSKLPSVSFVDRSWNWGSPTTHVHIHTSHPPMQETAQEKEVREKREAEEKKNRLIMIAAGVCSFVGAFFVGKQYQELSHTQDRERGLEQYVARITYIKTPVVDDIFEVFESYRNIYAKQITKMKVFLVLKAALFAEVTALCMSAFFKKIPLRDGIGVITFTTVVISALYYGMTYRMDAQLRRNVLELSVKIEAVKGEISRAVHTPPSYQEVMDVRAQQLYAERGHTPPRSDAQGVLWIQHHDSEVWLYWNAQQHQWIPTPHYIPHLSYAAMAAAVV